MKVSGAPNNKVFLTTTDQKLGSTPKQTHLTAAKIKTPTASFRTIKFQFYADSAPSFGSENP